jgi:CRISPR-associated endonuclease/helicase Cas3
MESNLFWGKSRRQENADVEWHPLVCHCLDVAAVADSILTNFPRRLNWTAGLLGADPAFLRGFIVRLIALHDAGKFHPDFQGKLEGHCEKHLPELVPFVRLAPARHDELGARIYEKFVQPYLAAQLPGWCPSDFNAVLDAVAFHHGAPGSTERIYGDRKACLAIEPAIQEFIESVFAIIPCEGTLPPPPETSLRIFSWALAGLTVLADWIGSNSEIFTFSPPPESLADYWAGSRIKADRAVRTAGILPVEPHSLTGPEELLPQPGVRGKSVQASPLQRLAFDFPVPATNPRLFIIEDVTGAGKTEAALVLASRLLSERAASGIYFALPTMATSNAMFERMGSVYRLLFEGTQLPSLILAHGRRSFHEGFANSILEGPLECAAVDADGAVPSEHACAAWIADDRRKAFFAHAGVGTIDQALLGVLPSRHQALRLWGLADRILIIDEAHCYDPYVNKELERLIEFHAALGGSAIVLSATLSMEVRQSLTSAFCNGTGIQAVKPSSLAYPLVTLASSVEFQELPSATREELRRTLPVCRLTSFEDALDAVAAAAETGAPVAWIRNAVDDAIEACENLEALGHRPLLLHARFAMGDRMDKEREIARCLGRESTPEDRQGFIAVGTQILEQSLDYDVDAMVTDLAPIDLIIQRAGRLWRHPARATRFLPAAELLIFSPDPEQVQDQKWYAAMSRRAAAVYRDHRVIWRSAKALFTAGSICTPDGLRDLISQVYDSEEPVPEAIETASREADGKRYSHRSIAEGTLLKLSEGYSGNNQIWHDDRKICTRLEEEPSVTFRLSRIENGKAVPWYKSESGGEDLRRAWALSEVSIQRRRADDVPEVSGAMAALMQAAKSDWGKWEKDIPLLVLEINGSTWFGTVTANGSKRTAYYDIRLGFRVAGSG